MLDNKVQVPAIQYENMKYKQGKAVDALALAKRWTTSPDRANNTFWKKTQQVLRVVTNIKMLWRYPTNDWMLRHPCLPHQLFTDTMIYWTVSKRGNNNSQVDATYFGWTHLLPIKMKSDAHDKLPLIFKHYSVPPDMIMDNSKEQLRRDFCRNLCQSNFHQKKIEPHPPWSTSAETDIRE